MSYARPVCDHSHEQTLDQGRGNTNRELDAPSIVASQRHSNTVRDELAARDGQRLDGHQSTSEPSRSKLRNVQRGNASRSTNTETEQRSTGDDLGYRERCTDDDSADDEPNVSDGENPFSTDLVGETAGNYGSQWSVTRPA